MQMEAMGFKGAIQVGMGLLDRFRVRGARAAMPLNPTIDPPLTRPNQVPTIGLQVSDSSRVGASPFGLPCSTAMVSRCMRVAKISA